MFPTNYQMGYGAYQMPQMAQQQMLQQQPQSQVQQQSNIVWVQGIEGAKGYQVPPNGNAMLMDSENSRFYIKSADSVGMVTMRMFDFAETTNAAPSNPVGTDEYATKAEVQALESKIAGYEAMFSGMIPSDEKGDKK